MTTLSNVMSSLQKCMLGSMSMFSQDTTRHCNMGKSRSTVAPETQTIWVGPHRTECDDQKRQLPKCERKHSRQAFTEPAIALRLDVALAAPRLRRFSRDAREMTTSDMQQTKNQMVHARKTESPNYPRHGHCQLSSIFTSSLLQSTLSIITL